MHIYVYFTMHTSKKAMWRIIHFYDWNGEWNNIYIQIIRLCFNMVNYRRSESGYWNAIGRSVRLHQSAQTRQRHGHCVASRVCESSGGLRSCQAAEQLFSIQVGLWRGRRDVETNTEITESLSRIVQWGNFEQAEGDQHRRHTWNVFEVNKMVICYVFMYLLRVFTTSYIYSYFRNFFLNIT